MSLAAGTRTIRTVLDVDANPLVRGMQRAEQATRSTADAIARGGQRIRQSTQEMATSAARGEGALVKFGRAAEQNSREFTQAGMAITAAGALLTGATVASAKAAIDWESAWIGVRKVLSGSPAEFAALEGELRELARTLPSSHQEIAAVAETAARLGVATGDVTAFTRTMIDMGETTTLSAEEAANGIARFSNVMGTATDDAGRVGSAIVDLGNNFATTETEILNMAQRLAAASNVAGMTEAEVLGLSAAMSEVGINAEAGGTAMSRVIMRISSAVEEGGGKMRAFADIAGMSSEEFATAWRDRPVDALMAVVGGLGQMTETGEGTFGMLEELGLQDVRVANMMLSLAGNADGAAEAVARSTQAWEENVALTREAEQRYASVESQIKMAWASITDAAITMGQTFLPVIVEVADMAAQTANAFANMSPEMASVVGWTGALAGGLGLVAGGLLLVMPRAMETYRAFQLLGIVGPRTSTAIRGVANVLTGPWGIAIAAALLAAGYFIRENQKKKQAIEEVRQTLDEETGALSENTRAWAAKKAQDEGLLEMADQLGLRTGLVVDAIMDETGAREELAAATKAHLDEWGRQDMMAGESSSQLGQNADAARKLNDAVGGLADTTEDALEVEARMRAERDAGAETTRNATLAWADMALAVRDFAAENGVAVESVNGWVSAADRAAAAGEAAADAYWDMNRGFAEASQAFIDSSGALSVANDAARAWAEAQAEATDSAEDSWEDFVGDFKGTVDEWLSELERMVAAQSDWEVNMLILASRASAGVVQAFEDLGPEGALLLQEFLDGGQETLRRGEAIFGEEAARGVQAYADGMSNTDVLKAAAARWGDDITAEIARKLESGEMTLAEVVAAYDLATEVTVGSDTAPFELQLGAAIGMANDAEGVASIMGDPSGFEDALDASIALGNSETSTPDIDGDPSPFVRELNAALAQANNETGTPKIDGDPALALGKLAGLMAVIRGSTGAVRADANTAPGVSSVFGLMWWISQQTATLNVVARLRGALDLGAGIGFGNYAGAIHDRGTRTYAAGGIDDQGRAVARQSMLAGPVYGKTNILWAEDPTRREAYISDHPSFRDRNVRILEQVAGWYGHSLVKAYATGGVAGQQQWAPTRWTPSPPVVSASPSGPVTATLAPEDRALLQAVAARPVRLEADGRALAQVVEQGKADHGGLLNTGGGPR